MRGRLEDVDQAVGVSRRTFAEVGVVGESEELREEGYGIGRGIVSRLGGESAQLEIVELRGIGDEVGDLAIIEVRDLKYLENLGEQGIRAGEIHEGLLRVKDDLVQRALG